MNMPTGASFLADTTIDWAGFGIPDEPTMNAEIALAWGMLEAMTGVDFESAPASSDPLILKATKFMVVANGADLRGGFSSLLSVTEGITSYSVPGYTETRQLSTAKGSLARGWLFHPWGPLDRLIKLLATQDAIDEAMAEASGRNLPFAEIGHQDEFIPNVGIEQGLY